MKKKENLKNIALFEINNPKNLNSLDLEIIKEIDNFLNKVEKNNYRYVVITGKGKLFSSGVNLKNFSYSEWKENPLGNICNKIEKLRIPSICILNGSVFGGAFELALACDFRIGHKNIVARMPPAKIGINYEPEGIRRIIKILGFQATKRILILGEQFNANQLFEMGFLDFLENNESSIEKRLFKIDKFLSDNAPMAVEGMKKTIMEFFKDNYEEDKARLRVMKCFLSDDFKEGLSAFRQKRKPIFKGK